MPDGGAFGSAAESGGIDGPNRCRLSSLGRHPPHPRSTPPARSANSPSGESLQPSGR